MTITMPKTTQPAQTVLPFMRYMGGKRMLLRKGLANNFPQTFKNYHEPFLGGGAVALNIMLNDDVHNVDRTYHLSDYSQNVVDSWAAVRDCPSELATELEYMFLHHSREQFNNIRDWDSDGVLDCRTLAARGARFIYLMHNCFGARVESDENGFLSPMSIGYRTAGSLTTPYKMDNMLAVSELLNRHDVRIFRASYECVRDNAGYGDFIFLDPPYDTAADDGKVLHSVYMAENTMSHENLLAVTNDVTAAGAMVLQSNSNTALIRKLYDGWATTSPEYYYGIRSTRKANDLLIANWRLAERLNARQEQHSLSLAA